MSEEENGARVASLKKLNLRLVKEVSSLRDQLSARSAPSRTPGSGRDRSDAAADLNSRAELEGLVAKASSLTAQLEEARKEKDELTREIDVLRGGGSRHPSPRAGDVEALRIRNNYLVAEARALRADNQSLDGRTFEQLHALQAQVEMLRSDKEALEKKVAQYKANVMDSSGDSVACNDELDWLVVRSRCATAAVGAIQSDTTSCEDARGDVFSCIQGQMVDISDSLDRIASENQAVDKSRREAKKRIKNAEVKLQMMAVQQETQVHRHQCDFMLGHDYTAGSPQLADHKGDRQDVTVAEVQRELEALRACLPRGRLGEETDGLKGRLGKAVQYIEIYEAENGAKERKSTEKLQEAMNQIKQSKSEIDSLKFQLSAMGSANVREFVKQVHLREAVNSRADDLAKKLEASQLVINEKTAAEHRAKCKCTELDDEMKVLISRLAEKDALNESSAVNRAALQNELKDVKARLGSQIEQERLKSQQMEAKTQQLELEHKQDEKTCQALRAELQAMTSSLESSLAENVDLKAQVSNYQDLASKSLADVRQQLADALENTRKSQANELEVVEQLEASKQQLCDLVNNNDSLKAELAKMRELLDRAEEEKNVLCESLASEQQATGVVSAELQDLKEEREALVSTKGELHALQQQWTMQQSLVESLERETQEFTSKIEGYIEREGNLRREAAQSRFAMEKSAAECEKLKMDLKVSQKNTMDLKADMAASQVESEGLIIVSRELQNAMDMANQEIQDKEAKLAQAERAVNKSLAEKEALVAENCELSKQKQAIESARDAAEKTLVETEAEVLKAFKELDASQVSIAGLVRQLEDVESQLTCSRCELADASAKLKLALEERDGVIEKISELSEEAGREREKVKLVLNDLAGKEKALARAVEDKEVVQKELSQIEVDFAKEVEKSGVLEADMELKKKEVGKLTAELQSDRQQMKIVAGERDAALADLDRVEAELDGVKADLDRCKQKHEKEKLNCKKEMDSVAIGLADAVEENVEVHAELLKAREGLGKLRYRVEAKLEEIDCIALERHRDSEAMLCLKGQLAEEENRSLALTREGAARAEEIGELRKQLAAAQNKLGVTESGMKALEAEQAACIGCMVSAVTRNALQLAVVREFEGECIEQRKAIGRIGAERDEVISQLERLRSTNTMHSEMIEILRARCYDKEEEADKANQELFEVQRELGFCKDSLRCVTGDRDEMASALKKVERSNQGHLDTIFDLEGRCQSKGEEISKAEISLKESEQAIAELRGYLGKARQDALALESRLRVAEEERDGFQGQLDKVMVKSRELEVAVGKTRQQIELVQEDLERSEAEKKDMDDALAALKEERDGALEEVQDARAEIGKLTQDIAKCVAEIESQRNEFERAQEELKTKVAAAENEQKHAENICREQTSQLERLQCELEAHSHENEQIQGALSRAEECRVGVAEELQAVVEREGKLRLMLEETKLEGLNLREERESLHAKLLNMECMLLEKTRVAAGVAALQQQVTEMGVKELTLASEIAHLTDTNRKWSCHASDLELELERSKEQENSLKRSLEERDGLEEALDKAHRGFAELQQHAAGVEKQVAKLQKDSVKKEALLVEEMRVLEGKLKLDVQKAAHRQEVAETAVRGLQMEVNRLQTRIRELAGLPKELDRAKQSEDRLKSELERAKSHRILSENLIFDLRGNLAALEEEVTSLKGARENEARLKVELEKDLAEKREVEREARELLSQIASLEEVVKDLKVNSQVGSGVDAAEPRNVGKRCLRPGMLSQILGSRPDQATDACLDWQQANPCSPRTWTGEVNRFASSESADGGLPGSLRACSMPTFNHIKKNAFNCMEPSHRAQSCPGNDDIDDNLMLTDEEVILESSSEEGHNPTSPGSGARISRTHSFGLNRRPNTSAVEEDMGFGGDLESDSMAVKNRELDVSMAGGARDSGLRDSEVSDPKHIFDEPEAPEGKQTWLMMGLGSTVGASLVVLAGVLVRACGRND